MKKYCTAFIIILLLVIGYFVIIKEKTTIDNPYEVAIDNKILSYYDKVDNVPESFNIMENSLVNYQNSTNTVLIDENNTIRCISITDKKVITYNQISIGDNIDKVKDKFSYECLMTDNIYAVIFDDTLEKDPSNQNKKDNWIWIVYMVENSKINKIMIYDKKFGTIMR